MGRCAPLGCSSFYGIMISSLSGVKIMPIEINCLICGKSKKRPPSQKGRFCSPQCWGRYNQGVNNGNWNGGIDHRTIYNINKLPENIIQRFNTKYRKTDSCWLWEGIKNRDGYGSFNLGRPCVSAHRIMWTLKNGPIPKGMSVLHECDVPGCVNPEHLFIGTQSDNIRDRDQKRRMKRRRNGQYARVCAS